MTSLIFFYNHHPRKHATCRLFIDKNFVENFFNQQKLLNQMKKDAQERLRMSLDNAIEKQSKQNHYIRSYEL
jgi:uncharacterized protein (UPF0332 family)